MGRDAIGERVVYAHRLGPNINAGRSDTSPFLSAHQEAILFSIDRSFERRCSGNGVGSSRQTSLIEVAMPSRNLLRSFLGLWLTTGIALLLGSIATVRDAWPGSGHGNPHLVVLGAVEAIAAALFVVPRTVRIGAIGLTVTIGVAFAVHALLGQVRGDLLVYGAAVVFVLVHGPLTKEQQRASFSRSVG
jgi:hypothetical protein